MSTDVKTPDLFAVAATVEPPRIPRRAQRVHEHSREARQQELGKLGDRASDVLRWLRARGGKHTDRDVMRGLGFTDPNSVRPRITELIDAQLVREAGSARDATTGKTVRLVEATS